MSQEQAQRQKQKMSPALLRSLKILQMPVAELRRVLLEEIRSNPMLELVDEGVSSSFTAYGYATSSGDYDLDSIEAERTLEEHILAQIADVDGKDKSILLFLLGRMDENGFVVESDELLASELGVTAADVTRVRDLLRSLDPEGLGSKGIKECLLGQIKGSDVRLTVLVSRHFEDLLRHRYSKIERAMAIDHVVLRSLIARLRMLNFRPAKTFSEPRPIAVVPDIILKKVYGEWQIDLNDKYLPKIKMSDSYKTMLICKNQLGKADRKFFSQNSMGAKILMNALNRRGDLLMKIARLLLDTQLEFFEGSGQLKPFRLKDLASTISVHQSTASRAIKEKYLQSPRGLFCLKHFFSKKLGGPGNELSTSALRDLIRDIIANEEKSRPLSDVEVCNMLHAKGIALTRRSVTKYRNAMKILPAQHRKFL
ncbi:MAG: RNA polymerase factor sigma-54 [Puniceicoccales bacterium]|nr:RNA polymerase factor sigma-54 [Puniceicoccales bacterium]